MNSWKRSVEASFSAAAHTYDGAAGLQALVAETLARWILEERARATAPAPRILEVGCGTGFLTRRLHAGLPGAAWTITDVSPAMLQRCRAHVDDPGASWRLLDGEYPELPPSSFDLIVSSLSFQWFEDLGAGLTRLGALLRPGGSVFFATLGADTFAEWRAACATAGAPARPPHYPRRADFPWPDDHAGELREAHLPTIHADGWAFLKSLRETGADRPPPGVVPLTPSQLRDAVARLGSPCTATYHVLYGVLRRG